MVTISAQALDAYSSALESAWHDSKQDFDISFKPVPGPSQGAAREADIIPAVNVRSNSPTQLSPLRPYLEQLNVNLGALVVPVQTFEDFRGVLLGLPLIAGEVQFYVNNRRVASTGGNPIAAWTFPVLQKVVETARQQSLLSDQLITGMSWANLNFWAAFVLASGGQVLDSNGMIDLPGAYHATASLVALARAARWDPNTLSKRFDRNGFQESTALVAFFQPWIIGMATKGNELRVQSMTPRRFPSGKTNVVPAFSPPVGLGVSRYSKRPVLASRVLAWLYENDQQRLLAHMGVPPIIRSSALRDLWYTLQERDPTVPRFDLEGYYDFEAMLPARVFPGMEAIPLAGQYQAAFLGSFRRVYAGESFSTVWADLRRLLSHALPVS